VRVKPGAEVRPAIARTIVDGGAELFAMRAGDRMLEKAYIEAVRSSGNQAE
jgi:hypothetical protein